MVDEQVIARLERDISDLKASSGESRKMRTLAILGCAFGALGIACALGAGIAAVKATGAAQQLEAQVGTLSSEIGTLSGQLDEAKAAQDALRRELAKRDSEGEVSTNDESNLVTTMTPEERASSDQVPFSSFVVPFSAYVAD